MTDAELDALEAVAKAATPGPWKHYNVKGHSCVTVFGRVFLPKLKMTVEDAAFISAANPSVVLALIAELRQAWKERDWLAGMLEKNEGCFHPRDEDSKIYCLTHSCIDCKYATKKHWLNAAEEATCSKED